MPTQPYGSTSTLFAVSSCDVPPESTIVASPERMYMNDPRLSLTRGNTPAPQAQIAKKPSAPLSTVFSCAKGTPSMIGAIETTSGSGPCRTCGGVENGGLHRLVVDAHAVSPCQAVGATTVSVTGRYAEQLE